MIQHNVAHWQQQQQPQQQSTQQQHQQNVLNANVPQQNQLSGLSMVPEQNNQKNSIVYGQAATAVAPPPTAQFFNHAAYQQKPIKSAEQPFPSFQQSLPQQPQHQTTLDSTYYYQNQPAVYSEQQQQGLAQNFFDHNQNDNNNVNNNNNNNNTLNSKSDGWGDWGDWNENNNPVDKPQDQQQSIFNTPSQQQPQQHQQPIYKPDNTASVINDSFNSNNNNNWNWNMLGANEQNNLSQNTMPQAPTSSSTIAAPTAAINASNVVLPPPLAMHTQATQQQSQGLEAKVEVAHPISHLVPAASLDIVKDNINNMSAVGVGANTANNIQSSVYVSQAKPVTMPSRQFASPPIEVQPLAEHVFSAPPPPPEGFQNEPPKMVSPPKTQVPLPAASVPNVPNNNPFKRAGASQHHVSSFIPTVPIGTKNAIAVAAPPSLFPMTNENNTNGASYFVPPPLEASPMQINFEQPENSEVLHENQEVLAQNFISNDINATAATQQPQPLNAERNQYLQTSHLSENSIDDSNVEGDSLPPPGLSRLVLGQPEFRANQQRMVTGTEDTLQNLNVNMNLEERQADGEDNASIPNTTINRNISNVPLTVNVVQSSIAPSTITNNMQMTDDRNLYMVPGQSNGNNDQLPRVITGFDKNDEILTTTLTQQQQPQQQQQHISGQREIDLDGENLEDQQQQQLPAKHQAINVNVITANRNEPPLEGAVAQVAPTQITSTTTTIANNVTSLADTQETSIHHNNNININNSGSAINVDSDREPQYKKQHGAGHSRKPNVNSDDSNTNNNISKRKEKEHEKKHKSVDRFDSDESADEEYSSDRERNRYKRNYREGSVRSERDHGRDRDREESDMQYQKECRRQDKGREMVEKEKQPRDKYYRGGVESGNDTRSERRSKRYPRYEQDSSHEDGSRKDQTQSRRSTRDNREHERKRDRRAGDRAEYDEYNRSYRSSKRVVESDEEQHAASRHRRDRNRKWEREQDSDTLERRRRRAGVPNKQRPLDMEREEYEKYRKKSSRDARDSDVEKKRAGISRYDPRYAGMYGYNHHGQTSSAYGSAYDPYAYYERMARFDPEAYKEIYEQYYGASGAVSAQGDVSARSIGLNATCAPVAGSDHLTGDGRESVHSGRSSMQHDHERYTQAYLTQAHEYHRHLQHQQQQLQQQQHHLLQKQNASINYQNITYDDHMTYRNGNGGQLLRTARSSSNLSLTHSELSRSCLPMVGNAYYANVITGNRSIQNAHSEYADSRSGNGSVRDSNVMPDPQRLTPCKFVNEHAVATLSAGLLVTVKPKYTPNGHSCNIVKVQRIAANDVTRQLLQTYPGPLVRGQTHKKTIIEFCEEQIRQGPQHTTIYTTQLLCTDIERFKPSYSLMWNLLILLVRQNGMVVGTDIAELLLKNQREFPYVSLKSAAHDESINEEQTHEDASTEGDQEEKPEDNNDVVMPGNAVVEVTLSESEITEKFRQYLLYGNVNEALDWAADNNLWGHALFLASKMDRRTHANVMMKFANKLSLNDPLQTLYQLMSGRTPSSVTSLQDDRWGDWRPHLSMILSNTSQKPELDRKAITTLGDSLFHQGDLYASHFCYLMAQVGFGRYDHGATLETNLLQHLPKLVLLGSSHYKQFRDFATNEAIIMTEIYEYACSLNVDKFSLVEFQPYKYLYATRLLDYGHHLKCFMYMEQIALHIERDSSKYDASFIKKVFELADRLKYYDPLLEKAITDDQPDNGEDALNGSTQSFEEQKWLQNLRNLVIEPQLEIVQNSSAEPNTENQIDQQFMEINRQFNELNMQYVATETQQEPQQPAYQQPPANVSNFEAQSHQQPPQSFSTENYSAQQSLPLQIQQPQQQPIHEQQLQPQPNAFYDPTQHQYGYGQDTQAGGIMNETATQNDQYDYWAQQQHQPQPYLTEENARPTISLPKTKLYDSDDDKRNQQRKTTTTQQTSMNDASKQQPKDNINKNDGNIKSSQAAQNTGWFGGIWNKLSLKPKNQMILPDDKNPSIVWDAAQKRWVNTDGGDDNTEKNLKPPPKMNDLMSKMQNVSQQQPQPPIQELPQMFQAPQMLQQQPLLPQQQQQQPLFESAAIASPNAVPTMSAVPAKTPTLQSNKFKMQRNRTLKNSYVDVFNPSGAPIANAADSIMAPVMPAATVPQTGFFQPGEPLQQSPDLNNYQQQQQQHQQQPQNVPQFYNPNQYG